MRRSVLSVLAILNILVLLSTPCWAQTKREIYELDFLYKARAGTSERAVAIYWNQLAKQEVNVIQSGRSLLQGIEAQQKLADLRIALAPIYEMEELRSNLSGAEGQILLADHAALYESDEIAEKVFQVLGPEYCTRLALKRLNLDLEIKREEQVRDWSSVTTYLSNETFATLLEMSDKQKKDLKSELEKAENELKKTTTELLANLEAKSDRRWGDLLDILYAHQRKQAELLLGKPIEWFRLAKQPNSAIFDTWLSTGGVTNGSRSCEVKAADGRSSTEMSQDELSQHGIEFFDSLVLEMLFETQLWDEMELTEQQREELTKRIRKELNMNVLAMPDGAARFPQLLQGKATYPKTVRDFFVPTQLEWFRQMELQIRLGKKYDSTVGLLNPTMMQVLALDPSQKTELGKVGEKYAQEERTLIGELVMARQKIQDELSVKLVAIMTPAQLKLYEKHTGRRLSAAKTAAQSNTTR